MMRFATVLLVALIVVLSPTAGITAGTAGRLYVANENANSISVIDASTFEVLTTTPTGPEPHNLEVSPDGRFVWVTKAGEMRKGDHAAMEADSNSAWAIRTSDGGVAAKIPVGEHPAHVTVLPSGRLAFVSNSEPGTVSIIDTATVKVVKTVKVGNWPHGMRASPDGRIVAVANVKSDTVSLIDVQTLEVGTAIPVGRAPVQVGFLPDGKTLYVSLRDENAVAIVNIARRGVDAKVKVGPGPIQLYATPDGRYVYVANQGTEQTPGDAVSVIDAQRRRVVKTIRVGKGAHGVVITP